MQVCGGWAEAERRGLRGPGDAAGHGAVWSDAGEGRCGPPAASGGDGADLDDADIGVVVVVIHSSTPNAAPSRPSVAYFSFSWRRCSKQLR